jgi:hypothetical protein
VRLFRRCHPEFDRIICFNNLDSAELNDLKSIADLYEQKPEDAPCPLDVQTGSYEESNGCGWKLAPPRLRPDSHELFIDNDIIILERLREISDWQCFDGFGLISEGLHRRRMYGVYDGFVLPKIHACAGLFGLPPGFDFAGRIKALLPHLNGKSLGGYNEQGLTTAIITNMENYMLVPLSTLFISEDHVPFPKQLPKGIHFVGANRKDWHRGWKSYLVTKAASLMM